MFSPILLIAGGILLLIAAFWNPTPPRVNLGWLGAACVAFSLILAQHHL